MSTWNCSRGQGLWYVSGNDPSRRLIWGRSLTAVIAPRTRVARERHSGTTPTASSLFLSARSSAGSVEATDERVTARKTYRACQRLNSGILN